MYEFSKCYVLKYRIDVLYKYKTKVTSCRLWLHVQSTLTLVQYFDWLPLSTFYL